MQHSRSPSSHQFPSVGALMDPQFVREAVAHAAGNTRNGPAVGSIAPHERLIERSRKAVLKTWESLAHLVHRH